MGSHKNILEQKITDKSKFVVWLIAPAICCGLLLLGFQFWLMLSGASMSNFDFNIGKLWASEKPDLVVNDGNSIFDKFYAIQQEEQEKMVLSSFSTASSVSVPVVNRVLDQFYDREEETSKKILSSSFLESNLDISSIAIPTLIQSKSLKKYFDRLESPYLINPEIEPKKGKWYIGFSFAPTLSYRRFGYDPMLVSGAVVNDNTIYNYGLTESDRNKTDKAVTSYFIGADVGRKVSDKIYVYSGLYISHYGEQIQVCQADDTDPNYSHSSFRERTPDYQYDQTREEHDYLPYTNTYTYVEIPLGVSIEAFSAQKSRITIDAGVNIQRLAKLNALVYDFETDFYYWMNEQEDIFRKYGIGSQLGISLNQYVGEQLELFVNPIFKYSLNSTFIKPYPISQNQYSTGVRIGFRKHLQ